MSRKRHARQSSNLTPDDERWFAVRSLVAFCDKGVRTTSSTAGWHRLIWTDAGVIIVRTAQGRWSTPSSSAVWLPEKSRAELEMCSSTTMRIFYFRAGKQNSDVDALPTECRQIGVGALLRELLSRIPINSMLDRRVAWQDAMAKLLRREIALSARPPLELIWPRDERASRIATLLQEDPGDSRKLDQLCRRQGVSPRTLQRLFPKETGLSFEQWRTRARILYATQLLAEGKKVDVVARRCGYQGASAFVAAFKRETGATPGRYCERGEERIASEEIS